MNNSATKTNHTPGPWTHYYHTTDLALIVGSARDGIARILPSGNREKDTANAKLIAAAPDLLAALNRLLRAFEADVEQVPSMDIVTSWETNSQAVQAARTAISKAEGAK